MAYVRDYFTSGMKLVFVMGRGVPLIDMRVIVAQEIGPACVARMI